MQKMILVKTPLTTDGNMPVIGTDGRQVYTESILTSVARSILEKRNQGLPAPLKVIIEDYESEPGATAPEDVKPVKTVKKVTEPV